LEHSNRTNVTFARHKNSAGDGNSHRPAVPAMIFSAASMSLAFEIIDLALRRFSRTCAE